MSDTEEIRIQGPAETPPAAADADASKRGFFGGKNKKTFGKLPPIKVEAPKSSRDAAADMIEQFRKRR